jgi:chromosome segregation ATPase
MDDKGLLLHISELNNVRDKLACQREQKLETQKGLVRELGEATSQFRNCSERVDLLKKDKSFLQYELEHLKRNIQIGRESEPILHTYFIGEGLNKISIHWNFAEVQYLRDALSEINSKSQALKSREEYFIQSTQVHLSMLNGIDEDMTARETALQNLEIENTITLSSGVR